MAQTTHQQLSLSLLISFKREVKNTLLPPQRSWGTILVTALKTQKQWLPLSLHLVSVVSLVGHRLKTTFWLGTDSGFCSVMILAVTTKLLPPQNTLDAKYYHEITPHFGQQSHFHHQRKSTVTTPSPEHYFYGYTANKMWVCF